MKILITTDCYAPAINGVVASVMNLQRELTLRGHEVRVITLSETKRSYTNKNVTYIGSISAEKIYPGARIVSSFLRDLIDEFVMWGPDIIHTQSEFSTFVIALKIASILKTPIIHTYHTVYEDYTHYFSPSKHLGRLMVSRFTRLVSGKTSCIIAPTDKVSTLLLSYGVKCDIQIIPTGIELYKFTKQPDMERLSALKHSLGVPESNLVLTYVGRLAKEKNLHELITFLADANRENITLMLIGDGPYRRELEQYAESLCVKNSIVFCGMVNPNDIADYYHMGDLFVSPSSSETQGLTYIEALASGLPAPCRKDSCLDGIVIEGKNGWQYENEQEFIKKLNLFADNKSLREFMSCETAQSVNNYSSDEFAEIIEIVYTHLVLESPQRKYTTSIKTI